MIYKWSVAHGLEQVCGKHHFHVYRSEEAYRYGTIAAFYDCLAKEPNLFLFFSEFSVKAECIFVYKWYILSGWRTVLCTLHRMLCWIVSLNKGFCKMDCKSSAAQFIDNWAESFSSLLDLSHWQVFCLMKTLSSVSVIVFSNFSFQQM